MTFARATGAVYLMYFVTAFGSAQLSGGVTALGRISPAAIQQPAYHLGVAMGEVSDLLYLTLVVLLYQLLRQVHNTAAMMALAFGAVGCAITALAAVFQNVAASDAGTAVTALNVNRQALHVALVFFAGFDAWIGFLIYRSRLLPRLIGAAMLVAGAGWLTALAPGVPASLAILVALVGGGAEIVLMLWLLVYGVRDTSATGDALAHDQLARAQ